MCFPHDLPVLPHGECLLCNPIPLKTQEPDTCLIPVLYPRGSHLVPGLGQPELTSVRNMALNILLGFTGRASVGRLRVSPLLRVASQETNAVCYFWQEPNPVVVIQFPKELCSSELKKMSPMLQRGASLQAPCPRVVQKSHQMLLTKAVR